MSKKGKAKATFQKHLVSLDQVTNVQMGNNWKASLREALSMYIGPQSSFVNRLDSLFFTRVETTMLKNAMGAVTDHVYDESKKDAFRDLIKGALTHVESNDVYSPEGNFLAT